ncbi:MAG: saccharopine dehydrogenase NADP-binding domain-containing protein [Pseudomonadales bacterium]|nr:saccharopine dehydrogenase NADP-binding domain-containing protein [Pseudomonadales bacterium]
MYDIVIWGATGHAGRQAAIYLNDKYGTQGTVRWAIAGRNPNKLEALKTELKAYDLDTLTIPGGDIDAAAKLVGSTRVVCSAIAPSAKYATEVVATCAEQGIDFCDLSGELHWLRTMFDQYDAIAKKTGARIINAAGFDSIPSDLSVQLLQESAFRQYGEYCHHIKSRFVEGKINVSGGSFVSGRGVLDAAKTDTHIDSLLANPHCLNPHDKLDAPAKPELDKVIWDDDFSQWIKSFPFGGINVRIVRRSNALLDFKYGKQFEYDEAQIAGTSFIDKVKAQCISSMTKMFIEGDPNSLLIKIMNRFAPAEGDGPSDKDIAKSGPFSFALLGKTPSGHRLKSYVYSDWDPGHGGTAAMLCETALCLAYDKDKTPNVSGFLTPSVALGETLRRRLAENAHIEIALGELESSNKMTSFSLDN